MSQNIVTLLFDRCILFVSVILLELSPETLHLFLYVRLTVSSKSTGTVAQLL